MKLAKALILVAMFFGAGAHVYLLFTSPYFLVWLEIIQLMLATSIMLFSLIAFIAIVEPHKHVKEISSYILLMLITLLIISTEYIVELLVPLS